MVSGESQHAGDIRVDVIFALANALTLGATIVAMTIKAQRWESVHTFLFIVENGLFYEACDRLDFDPGALRSKIIILLIRRCSPLNGSLTVTLTLVT